MQTEIEAKFLQVKPDEIRTRLKKAGAQCEQPMKLMRRVVFDNDVMRKKDAFVRVRDEGYRITMTYKQYDEMSLTGAKEIEFTVSDYDAAIAFCEAAGIVPKSVQEARREVWKLDDVEVVIDEWPWIRPFVEIEGPAEDSVVAAAEKLDFKWENAAFGDIMTAYRAEFPGTGTTPADMVYNQSDVRFDDPVPDILKR